MAFLDIYRQQVALLIRAIPFVAKEAAFALKGGTAINLFVRDLPRLSPTSMLARSWPRSTASIRAIFSTCATCWRTKA